MCPVRIRAASEEQELPRYKSGKIGSDTEGATEVVIGTEVPCQVLYNTPQHFPGLETVFEGCPVHLTSSEALDLWLSAGLSLQVQRDGYREIQGV